MSTIDNEYRVIKEKLANGKIFGKTIDMDDHKAVAVAAYWMGRQREFERMCDSTYWIGREHEFESR